MLNLESFVEVYGNVLQRRRYLLALRFKKPIVHYHSLFSQPAPIEIPNQSIIVIHGKSPTIKDNHSSLIFSVERSDGNNHSATNATTLLLTLLPANCIIKSFICPNVLYVITTRNPFQAFWQKCRRDVAFRALQTLIDATLFEGRLLTMEEMALLRFFKCHSFQLNNFSSWHTVVYQLSYKSFMEILQTQPFPDLGQNIYEIFKRSLDHHTKILPEPNFYECEIFFTNTDPVGVLYKIEGANLLYVSPMIITQPPTFPFKDMNQIHCNFWIPLYKNHNNWMNFGIRYYFVQFFKRRYDLIRILTWLQIQTIEKYKFIYWDLINIGEIILGKEKSRWGLKPL